MDEYICQLADKLKVNTAEAYLSIEPIKNGFKLWIIEHGTGGCTFPDMELLAEKALQEEEPLSKTFQDDSFLKELLDVKQNIAKSNPHLYDTVFLSE